MSRKDVYFLYLILFTFLSLVFLVRELNTYHPPFPFNQVLVVYSLFDFFLLELCVLLWAAQLLINRGIFSRICLYATSSIFIVIYFMQMASFYYGKEFLTRLAIDNVDHFYLFFDVKGLLFIGAIVTTCVFLILLAEFQQAKTDKRSFTLGTSILTASTIVILTGKLWLPASVIDARDGYLGERNLAHTSPLLSIYSTLFQQEGRAAQPLVRGGLKAYELEELKKFGFFYDAASEFPLIKPSIYSNPPPFSLNSNEADSTPNVIVLFSEGLSARSIGAYGGVYSDLTPSIDRLAGSSLVVRRYYSHTAATYRGLHGQLASIFPLYGGVDGWHSDLDKVSGRNYLTLADLFKLQGYETIFLDSHHKNHPSKVDEMMTELGFSLVITGDQLAAIYLNDDPPLGQSAYSDHQYFQFVIRFLQQRLLGPEKGKPFFLSLYNFGTHPFLKNSKDGVRYGGGKNATLNNIHNFDHAFGLFWNYLQKSPYFDNTIFIFTSDHCHFHEKTFIKAFEDPDYQQLFIDRIPLIIHDPLRDLPETFDADNASSIDFAPSVAHYLGLKNISNPWLGGSIFERDSIRYSNKSVAALGPHEIFLITDDKIHSLNEDGSHQTSLEILDNYISIVRQLELENQIWKEDSLPIP